MRPLLLMLVLIAALPPAARADDPPLAPLDEDPETVIILKDGRRLTGSLVATDENHLVLRIEGIDTRIPRAEMDSLERLPSVSDRYKEMRDAIREDDVDRRLSLAQWLIDRRRYDWALLEVEKALRAAPSSPQAQRLKLLITEQQRLEEESRRRAGTTRPRPTSPGAPARPREGPPLLSPADVNRIRVYELDLKNPPRLSVPASLVPQLIAKYGADEGMPQTEVECRALLQAPPARVLGLLFSLRARDLYDQIQVLEDPASMRLFRGEIATGWLINSCATTRCHGGQEAGELALARTQPNADATVYTNFYILDTFRLADGRPLINYQEPAKSPLLQLGLPQEKSTFPHPRVPGRAPKSDLFKPVFTGPDDAAFQQAVRWIRSMYAPRPDYGIEYPPAAPSPSEGPAATSPPVPAKER